MASEKAPAFQFYPRDFLSDERVMVMDSAGRGAYITLLCVCWLEGSLPTAERAIARLAGCSLNEWKRIRADVLACFYESDGRYYHKRLELERKGQAERREQQSKAGRTSAQRRFNARSTSVQQAFNETSTLHLQSSSAVQEPPIPPTTLPLPKPGQPLTVEAIFGAEDEPDPVAERIAAVVDLWARVFRECRHGATFKPNPVRDYQALKEIAEVYGGDMVHLGEMLRFFFLASDLPDWATSRSPKCFLKLAPETDTAVRAQRRTA